MTGPPALLEARDLRVARDGVPVLDVASFAVAPGEIVALIGPNGSGKTTLLLSLMCLLPRAGGRVRWRGADVPDGAGAVPFRRKMAMILQEPLLFRGSVRENVASGLRIRGVPRAEAERRVEAALERFELVALAGRSAGALSGGEARRVSLARALVLEPEVALLDEPFANLDPSAREAITDHLERTLRETGTAAVLVTHDPADALRLADRIAVMRGGRIVQADAPAVVMNAPADEFVASCVGMDTVLEGKVLRRAGGAIVAAVAGREVHAIAEAAPGETVYCCIRPEQVTIELANPAGASSARNVFPARVASVASAGPYLRVKLDCGFPLVATVTPESFATLGLARGAALYASFKATAIHVIRKGEPGPRARGR